MKKDNDKSPKRDKTNSVQYIQDYLRDLNGLFYGLEHNPTLKEIKNKPKHLKMLTRLSKAIHTRMKDIVKESGIAPSFNEESGLGKMVTSEKDVEQDESIPEELHYLNESTKAVVRIALMVDPKFQMEMLEMMADLKTTVEEQLAKQKQAEVDSLMKDKAIVAAAKDKDNDA